MALGVWNLVMVATLSKLLVNPAAVYSVGPETVRFLFMATPFLQARPAVVVLVSPRVGSAGVGANQK